MLVITSKFQGFEETNDRLDILALDRDGKLVVVELKRDMADKATDLQAIKYASYCCTLTVVDIQKEYRTFWNSRDGADYSPEEAGEEFVEFFNATGTFQIRMKDEAANF